jgi:hypothetical protein
MGTLWSPNASSMSITKYRRYDITLLKICAAPTRRRIPGEEELLGSPNTQDSRQTDYSGRCPTICGTNSGILTHNTQYGSLIDDSKPTSKDTQPNRLLSTSGLWRRQEKHSQHGASAAAWRPRWSPLLLLPVFRHAGAACGDGHVANFGGFMRLDGNSSRTSTIPTKNHLTARFILVCCKSL